MTPNLNQLKAALRDGPSKLESFNPRQPRKRSHFYVRDASECPIATYMDCRGRQRPPMPPRVLALQQRGMDLEAQVLSSLRAFYPETKVHIPTLKVLFTTAIGPGPEIETFFIAGRPDALLHNTILEIKSVGSDVYNDMRTEDNVPQRHRDQLLLYGRMFGLRDLVLIVVDRNDHRHRVFAVSPDSDRINLLLSRLGLVSKALKDEIPPERDVNEPCAYYCSCWTLKEPNGTQTSEPSDSNPPPVVPDSGEAGRGDSPASTDGTLLLDSTTTYEEAVYDGVPEGPSVLRSLEHSRR